MKSLFLILVILVGLPAFAQIQNGYPPKLDPTTTKAATTTPTKLSNSEEYIAAQDLLWQLVDKLKQTEMSCATTNYRLYRTSDLFQMYMILSGKDPYSIMKKQLSPLCSDTLESDYLACFKNKDLHIIAKRVSVDRDVIRIGLKLDKGGERGLDEALDYFLKLSNPEAE